MIRVNYQSIDMFKFPGGELQIRLPDCCHDDYGNVRVKAKIQSSDDLMALLLVANALNQNKGFYNHISLELPYMPYARQDRACQAGEAFSLQVAAQLINSCKFDSVLVIDPHSLVTPALIDNCSVLYPVDLLHPSYITDHITHLVSPDAGAEKKVHALGAVFKLPVISAGKVRSVQTGTIIRTQVYGHVPSDSSCLIVDDICDGGATFTALARELKLSGAGSVYLYVTHGIFSKALGPLRQYIDGVYCYDCWLPEKHRDPKYLTILGEDYADRPIDSD